MSGSSLHGGTIRTPLQPREMPTISNSINVPESHSSPPSEFQTTSQFYKRHNCDLNSVIKNENEPLALHNKRQKTLSGSDIIELSESSIENSIAVKNYKDTGYKCHNRTGKLPCSEVESNLSNTSDKNLEALTINIEQSVNECICDGKSEHTVINCDSFSEKLEHFSTENNYLKDKNLIGNISPHCAATLEYVTQLPVGCCNNVSISPFLHSPVSDVQDSEGEDDDNYLDSSDADGESSAFSNNLDEDESCGEDDQSVISTVTVGSTCSLRSVTSEALSTICINENGVAANEDGSLLYGKIPSSAPLEPLSLSLFSNVPPAINFCHYNEKTKQLPLAVSKLLRWRFSTVTPLIVKRTLTNSGFKVIRKTVQWIGTWGKHMKAPCFKTVKDFQKVNHFPGTFQIGRKDKLWKNFLKLQLKFGREEFGFLPKTFVLPGDLKLLKTAFDKEGIKKKWIIKPPASARGTGIQVVSKWSELPADTPVVVQRYISKPYLINDTKFDMRIYVLITSFHPLRIYLYQDGLVRFASGFDVILDEKLRPWLLEVNISPSLHSSSPLDHSVKGPLIADVLTLASYHIPDKFTLQEQKEIIEEMQLQDKISVLCLDRRLYTRILSIEEKAKHAQIVNQPRSQYLTSTLESLTPDDVRHLITAEDELNRAGQFACIFPTADTHHYFGFMEKPRYYNRLFDAWEIYQNGDREKGIALLEKLCKERCHLKVPVKFKLPKA